MRCLGFGSTSAIDEARASESTAIVIGIENKRTENSIPNDSVHENWATISILLETKCAAVIKKSVGRILSSIINPWQDGVFIRQAQSDNSIEVSFWNDPHCCLCTPRNTSCRIQYT